MPSELISGKQNNNKSQSLVILMAQISVMYTCKAEEKSHFSLHEHSFLLVIIIIINTNTYFAIRMFRQPISNLFQVINTYFFATVRNIAEFSSEVVYIMWTYQNVLL